MNNPLTAEQRQKINNKTPYVGAGRDTRMYWKYLKYVIKHKWFVFVECHKRGAVWRGITHDISKFRPSEFVPYARYFYGNYPSLASVSAGMKYEYHGLYREDIENQFDKAWLLHIHRNPHHWQHWLLQEDNGNLKKLPIPVKYLKEMGCDWIGAGKAITGEDNIREWYHQNKDKIQLRKINRRWVENKFVPGLPNWKKRND